MAAVEKMCTIVMGQSGGSKMPIHVDGLQKSEITSIRSCLDSTNVYKSESYSVVYEETTFTNETMALPTAIDMTGKRDVTVQIKLRNEYKQNLFIGLECPVNVASTTDLNNWVQSFVNQNITGFGTVSEANFTLKM